VARLLSDLETEGRMARVLVTVNDPLRLTSGGRESGPPLLIGEYVRVEIQGRQLTDVYRIPRSALRDRDTIWTLTDENTLEIVQVQPIWSDAESVLVKNGIVPGQPLIVSDLPAVVDGMALKQDGKKTPEMNSIAHDKAKRKHG
jgi:multidrug efflux pump subunit AcrA (membrane-fusion protein)